MTPKKRHSSDEVKEEEEGGELDPDTLQKILETRRLQEVEATHDDGDEDDHGDQKMPAKPRDRPSRSRSPRQPRSGGHHRNGDHHHRHRHHDSPSNHGTKGHNNHGHPVPNHHDNSAQSHGHGGVARRRTQTVETDNDDEGDDLIALKYVRARIEAMDSSDADADTDSELKRVSNASTPAPAAAATTATTNDDPSSEQHTKGELSGEQRPGAYKGAPGEGLHRNTSLRFSRLCMPRAIGGSSKASMTSSSKASFMTNSFASSVKSSVKTAATASVRLSEDTIMPPLPPTAELSSDVMLSATLVDEENLVCAEKAPEGFEALRQNNKFKYLIGCILLMLVAIIVPMAVFLPKKEGNSSEITTIVNINETVIQCGTALTNQADFRGTINVSETGIPCQRWDSQFPNSHNFSPERFPNAGLDENYCRNPNGSVRPWCISNLTGITRKLFCDVPYCDGEDTVNTLLCGTLKTLRQSDYRGKINVSMNDRACLDWSVWKYAEQYANLDANYCRNPNQEATAWCFVGDGPDNYWKEHCNVPICEVMYYDPSSSSETTASQGTSNETEVGGDDKTTCGTMKLLQSDYRGTSNLSESGFKCQRWDSQEPHGHDRTPSNYPWAGLDENYCRNPDGEPKAWCYTTNPQKRWEYCSIPACRDANMTECGTYDWKQKDYVGMRNVTESGRACQRWDAQSPHYHFNLPALFPEKNLAGNACRNPTGDERAWCYTLDPEVIWEYCGVPFCSSPEERERSFVCGTKEKHQADYRGTVSVSESGRRCQDWSSQFPHKHDLSPAEHPYLTENHCRNPDADERAWCYTEDLHVRYESCAVPFCEEMSEEEEEEVDEEISCGNCTECGLERDQQRTYRGFQNETASGLPCQAWNEQFPHEHTRTPEIYPDAGLEGNYCRNPDGEPRAWCYTTWDDRRWDYCAVPFC